MSENKIMTVPKKTVGAESGQPDKNINGYSITDSYSFDKHELETMTMTELYNTCYQPGIPVIEGLLYKGIYLFVGAPKIGKSFLMAQIGYHVSTGIPLWDFKVNQGTVLYLALEDKYSRLQKRLSGMFGVESSEHYYLAVQAQSLNDGLMEQLDAFVTGHRDTVLIIIDTLQMIREQTGESINYGNDYNTVVSLKNFTDKHNLCMLVVHHTRKLQAKDSFEKISGTNGLLGAADGAFVMEKANRSGQTAILDITGRDQQDMKLKLSFCEASHSWELVRAETVAWEDPPDPLLESISDFVKSMDGIWRGTASELLPNLPGTELKANKLTQKLNTCVERLWNEYGIRYCPCERTGSRRELMLQAVEQSNDD